jgi:alkylhydroperoxidase family enzyme
LPLAVIGEPRGIAAAWRDDRVRMLAELAIVVAEAPWRLSGEHLRRAHRAGLADDDVIHAVALASLFGHLNRIADAVAVPLDYAVRHSPPAADAAVPAWPAAPGWVGFDRSGHEQPGLDLARRPATEVAIAAWRDYVMHRPAPLDAQQRALIARSVARLLGDARAVDGVDDCAASDLDGPLIALAERVTLAPWQLGPASYAPLRAAGFDDAAVFDVCATASSAGAFSRIHVALAALSRG